VTLPQTSERRQRPRHNLRRIATMLLGGGQLRYCVVTDFSEVGVRITSHGFRVPDEFVLRFFSSEDLKNGAYRVIWRNDYIVGAEFVGAQSPETWARPTRATHKRLV
jgi:hypothetical protein